MGSRRPSSRWAMHRRTHFWPNSLSAAYSGMKLAAKLVARVALLVPTIRDRGISLVGWRTSAMMPQCSRYSSRWARCPFSPRAVRLSCSRQPARQAFVYISRASAMVAMLLTSGSFSSSMLHVVNCTCQVWEFPAIRGECGGWGPKRPASTPTARLRRRPGKKNAKNPRNTGKKRLRFCEQCCKL